MPNQETVEWSVDGDPVRLVWSSASGVAPGGFDRMSGVRVPMSSMPITAGPFSILKGVRSSGKVFYIGQIDNTPKLLRGEAVFSTEGLKERITRQRGRRLYQDRQISNLVTADAEPFVAGAYPMHRSIAPSVGEGKISMQIAGDTYANNDRSGVIVWERGDS